jgi:hypothetical protein
VAIFYHSTCSAFVIECQKESGFSVAYQDMSIHPTVLQIDYLSSCGVVVLELLAFDVEFPDVVELPDVFDAADVCG